MDNDPYLWLEDIDGERSMQWVAEHNTPTIARLAGARFDELRAEALQVLDSDERIPDVARRGDYLYNFWRDAERPRGLWRRTTLEEYRSDAPTWDVVIDVDALAATEGENWHWAGVDVIAPEFTRALVEFTRGGGDTTVVREFDMETRQFVSDGFILPEAKHDVSWLDEDTLLVGTDFGDGSLTTSGYPRVLRRWRRGTAREDAETVFEGEASDVAVGAQVSREPGFERTFIYRIVDFFNKETYELRGGELIRLDIPTDCSMATHRQWAMMMLLSEFDHAGRSYPAGSVLVTRYDDLLAGNAEFQPVFEPGGGDFLAMGTFTGEVFLSIKLRDVPTVVEVVTPGTWEAVPLPGVPENTNTTLAGLDPFGDEIFLYSSGFVEPTRLLHGPSAGPVEEVKRAPTLFDSGNLIVDQRFALSDDGTRIPYFLVKHRDSSGPGPTLMDGYGAFRMARLPGYLGLFGRLWLERGGSYALTNIRGGGEYGPDWHDQAVRENRHKVAEDFSAIARDLVDTGVTTPRRLGAVGGSAGGLLMGIMLTRYPELFGAIVCQNPLLDMRRYHLLLAGASWTAEFGDPEDPAAWEYIAKESPYHQISSDCDYPAVLMMTSTNDDRVHPGHARKMTAALEAAGREVYYYENTEGGHAGVADNAQAAFQAAVVYEFLLRTLM